MTDEQKPDEGAEDATEFGVPVGEIAGAETPAGEDEDADEEEGSGA